MRAACNIIAAVLIATTAQAGSFVYTGSLPWARAAHLAAANGGTPADYSLSMADGGTRIDTAAPWLTVAALDAVDINAASNAYYNPPPAETDRVAYTNGWSVRIEADGTETRWRHRNSPFDPATDAAQYEQAKATNSLAKAQLRQIARQLKDTSGTQAQQLARTRTAALDLCRWLRVHVVKDPLPEDAP